MEVVAEACGEAAVPSGGNRGHFKVGGDPRRGPGRAKVLLAGHVGKTVVERAGNPLLTAFRHVLANAKVHDGPGLEREAREWLKSDRKGFLTKYSELERAESDGKAEVARVIAGSEEGVDGAEERVLEVIGELEAELGAIHAVAG